VRKASVATLAAAGFGSALAALLSTSIALASQPKIEFDLVTSAGAQTCLPDATAHVIIQSHGSVDVMSVKASGLPPRTPFDLFVIQVPKSPFGVSSYEGDFTTNARGKAHLKVVGRFNVETFVVAPGSAMAPVVHNGAFPDASLNPSMNPIHLYHLGVWFDSPADAHTAGCAATLTPFNGTHTAGIQAMNTSTFPDDHGPLRQLAP
jgi:hypothetical protein